jgi:hypothetical protein
MASKYKAQQIEKMTNVIYKEGHLTRQSSIQLAEKLYSNKCRTYSKFFLFLHILIGTFHLFFFVPMIFVIIGIYGMQVEMQVNPYFIVFPLIPFLSMLCMIGYSIMEARKR